ncbi:MAG: TIGR02996 domain-containing protein [Planctomycetes bacterium]|nr:TIGR02996 domain-containing protein [Planctomycetota bacterium]
MSEESAFLAALKANPADDLTRLVYADWLDERGEPAKAEYLRLITSVPRRGDDVDTSSAEATRANELGLPLPAEWKEAAAGRFDVVLLNFTDVVRGLKCVRELFGVGLGDARAMIELAPNRLLTRVPFDSALNYFSRLTEGAGMSLAVRPSECHGSPRAVVYQVIAECYLVRDKGGTWPRFGDDLARDADARSALTRLVADALSIGSDVAQSRVTEYRFVLADEAPFFPARRLVERCHSLCTREERFATSCYISGCVRVVP